MTGAEKKHLANSAIVAKCTAIAAAGSFRLGSILPILFATARF
jgi:hypothetical protein